MILNEIEFLNGLLSLIYSLITLLLGLLIASKYRKHKQTSLLYIGISISAFAMPWYPSSISFLMIILTGNGLSEQAYFFIGIAFIPLLIFVWMFGITEFIFENNRKIILAIYALVGIVFDIFFIYYLLSDPGSIGTLQGPLDVEYHGFTRIYLIFLIATVLITVITFGVKALKSDKPDIRLKGKFISIAIFFWLTGAVADAFIPLTIATLLIIRIILITSIILNYIGWIMPEPIKKLFIKDIET